MLSLLSSLLISQTTPKELPERIPDQFVQIHSVRPLPGNLDNVPVFNSNSPELVLKEGILLSTLPSRGKTNTNAHLNFPFQGRFDIFAHHVAKAPQPQDLRTLYLGVILENPLQRPVTVAILQGASYLSQPDAPFIPLMGVRNNLFGTVYSGPGSRVMNEILRGNRQQNFPASVTIPPGKRRMLLNAPIPVRDLDPPLNGRSTYLRLRSDGKVYAASLAMFATKNEQGKETVPTLAQWEQLLKTGALVKPRDRAPTPPNSTSGSLIYGRVAGVSLGSWWQARLIDEPGSNSDRLTIPEPGKAFSYGLSTLPGGTLGTNQIQSASMLARYPDTAYGAHGNYGIQYSLSLPLFNPTQESKSVSIAIQTPLKQDRLAGGLSFLEPPNQQVFFRGTVRIRYPDDERVTQTRYFHLVQHQGEQGEPLVKITIPKIEKRLVEVDLIYPPDATPPQVLTVKTER